MYYIGSLSSYDQNHTRKLRKQAFPQIMGEKEIQIFQIIFQPNKLVIKLILSKLLFLRLKMDQTQSKSISIDIYKIFASHKIEKQCTVYKLQIRSLLTFKSLLKGP